MGIEIEFFEPHMPEVVMTGRLFIDQDGKDYFEFWGDMNDCFRVFKVVFAVAVDSDEKYTLVNCFFKQSNFGSYRFIINELYKGDYIDKVTESNCIGAEARMTGLTNWINNPRIKPEIRFLTSEQGKVIVKEFFTKSFIITDNITLELCEFCEENYSRNETVLRNMSYVKFIANMPVSRLELYKNTTAFLKFLSLFTDDLPQFTRLNYSFSKEKHVEYFGSSQLKETAENEALLTFDLLEVYCKKALELFYRDRDKYVKVLDLLNASIKNNTSEISFLNITTAFEVVHKFFYEKDNEETRKGLHDELLKAGLIKRATKKWEQVIRYHHLFKLTESIDFVKQNFVNPLKTIDLIRESRNYYTHYSDTEKEIWTPNRLLYANKALRQLLKAVILKQLLLPNELVNKLLNNKAAFFYHDYKKNEYSHNYLDAINKK